MIGSPRGPLFFIKIRLLEVNLVKKRCAWSEQTESMRIYHDTVWGVPEYDDQRLFRKLMLDINQAGLSWQTILNKSEAFDEAYDSFAIEKVARYQEDKINELMENKGIIRNRRKIEAAIANAKAVQQIQAEFGSSQAIYGDSRIRK